MVFKSVLVSALAAASLFASAATVAAAAPTLTNTSPTGYYIWHNRDGFHLRTHGPAAEHDFTAQLRTDGTFESVDTVRLENRDNVAVTDGGQQIDMHFHTYGATDGIDFRIKAGTELSLALSLDGQPIDTQSIFLGAKLRHPKHNPFTIHLHRRQRQAS